MGTLNGNNKKEPGGDNGKRFLGFSNALFST